MKKHMLKYLSNPSFPVYRIPPLCYWDEDMMKTYLASHARCGHSDPAFLHTATAQTCRSATSQIGLQH